MQQLQGSRVEDGSSQSSSGHPYYSLDGTTSDSDSCSRLLLEYRFALLEAFEDVFGLTLTPVK